jgi:hypothetical protein
MNPVLVFRVAETSARKRGLLMTSELIKRSRERERERERERASILHTYTNAYIERAVEEMTTFRKRQEIRRKMIKRSAICLDMIVSLPERERTAVAVVAGSRRQKRSSNPAKIDLQMAVTLFNGCFRRAVYNSRRPFKVPSARIGVWINNA